MTAPLTAAAAGLLAGLSLIVAIGAQNAFVLRQGLVRHHVGAVVAVCAVSDAVLVVAGVAGTGALLAHRPGVVEAVRWGGAAFLAAYAVLSLRRAARGGGALRATSAPGSTGRRALAGVLAQAFALTWLNPHVYLDTVLLLGSLAQQQPSRWAFATGAAAGSLLWFAGLGFGARLLAPVFARPTAWRVLDTLVGLTMAALAVALVTD